MPDPPDTQQHLYALQVELEALKLFFEERSRRIDDRFRAAEVAVEKAAHDNARWRDASNEWRAAMNDREDRFAVKEVMETAFAMSMKDREGIHAELRTMATRESLLAMNVSHDTCIDGIHRDLDLINTALSAVRVDLTALTAKGAGLNAAWGYIIAAITAMGGIGVTIAFVTK
jgi:hypothetical protein